MYTVEKMDTKILHRNGTKVVPIRTHRIEMKKMVSNIVIQSGDHNGLNHRLTSGIRHSA